ncbi:hypothetical protein J6A32_01885 [Methanocorpusculum sp.]|nr:hypothetical protein [Methanocorpusculum sp.]
MKKKNADNADAAFGCATRRCRSRFGVDLGFEDITQQLQSGCDSRFCRQAKQRRAARALARISAISVFFQI